MILLNINIVGFIFIVRFYFVCFFFYLFELNFYYMFFKNVVIVKFWVILFEFGIFLVREVYLNGYVKN